MSTLHLKDWLTAMSEATAETASQTLSCESSADGCETKEQIDLPDDVSGSFLTLFTEKDSVQVGIVANKKSLENMAKAMLCMGPEETVATADITDAIGEIINIVAGGVKRRLNEPTGGIKLGLPMFVEGKVAQGESQEGAVSQIKIGESLAYLLVLRKKG